ncbi:MAG TPA: serine hydrolase domain-containing protein [Candidatus Limnocylindria bacterium]|nr:serine hydrolase domain-containing protein [Candidatus Limnocylindria bacterium]
MRAAIVSAVEKERMRYGGGRGPLPAVLVGVWDDSGREYVRTFGPADLATRRPLTAADSFRIGSNTKTFVISVLLQLVDEGKLRLDDPLSRFALGVTIPNARNITVRELCEMRSGLFEAYDTPQIDEMKIKPNDTFDSRTLVRYAVQHKPYFAPGKGYRYSNTNYLLLGLIIESVTKDSIANQIRKRLLVPFALTHTSYPSTQAMPAPWAHGYGLNRKRTWEDVSGTVPVSLMGAAGAMVSDMADMKRWVRLYVTGKTNGPATQRARLHCVWTGVGNLSFGLGIGCSAGWYGYTGGLPGYNTAGYYFPSTRTTIVAFVMMQSETPFPGVANSIFRAIATIMTPANVPFVKGDKDSGRSGL